MKNVSVQKTKLDSLGQFGESSVSFQRNVYRGRLRFRKQRRGAMVVLCAVSMIVLLAFAMLLVDVAWISVVQTEAQVASDLASRSSLTAYSTDQSGESFSYRKARAQRIGELVFESNTIGQNSVDINPEDIQLGVKTADGEISQTQNFATSALIDLPTVGNGFGFFLAPMFGHDSFDTESRSLASYSPIEVILCVDISRSMAWKPGSNKAPGGETIHQPPLLGSRWLAAVDAINLFLSKAAVQAPTLRVGLVTFGGGVLTEVDSPWDDSSTRVSVDLDLISQAQRKKVSSELDYISDNVLGWTTPTFEALDLSLQHLNAESDGNQEQMVILLTDGKANTADPLTAAKALANEGITIHTIYFSGGGNAAAELKALSDAAGGVNLQPDNPQELNDAFEKILTLLAVRIVE